MSQNKKIKLDQQKLDMGLSLLQNFLQAIDIKVDGKIVYVTYKLGFSDENVAKTFAESLKETYEAGI